MRFVSQALERVRALLFGPRRPGMHPLPDHPVQTPRYPVQPLWEPGDAGLAFACLCRAGRGPSPMDAGRAEGAEHPVVRAYVVPSGKRQRGLSVRQFTGASR